MYGPVDKDHFHLFWFGEEYNRYASCHILLSVYRKIGNEIETRCAEMDLEELE